MPSPTTPDAITRWIISDAGSLLSESVAQGNSLQTALDSRQLRTFRWADDSARNSQLTVRDGDMGYQIDTGVWYNRVSGVWRTAVSNDDSGWIQVTGFVNSWTAAVSVFYRRIRGVIYMRGRLTGGASGTAFTLPIGFRPTVRETEDLQFACTSGTTATLARVRINFNGEVGALTGGTPNLNPVQFPVDE